MRKPTIKRLRGFADRLNEAMEKKQKSQIILARACNVDRKTIASWQTMQSEPRAYELAVLCTKLNVSADWLLFGKEV